MRDQILRGSAGTGLLMTLQVVFGVVITLVLARLMGPEELGVYSFGLAVASLLTIPTRKGLSGWLTREVVHAVGAEDWGHLRGVMRWAWGSTVMYSVIICGPVAAGCLLFAPKEPLAQATALSMLLVPAWSLLGNWSGGVRGLIRPVSASLADTVLRPVFHIMLIGAVGLFSAKLTPSIAIQLHIIATSVAALWTMEVFRRHLPPPAKAIAHVRTETWKWARAAVPFAAISGLQSLIGQTDLIVLGLLTDETQTIGLYRVALQGSMLIAFGSQAVNLVVAPYFARHRTNGGLQTLWTLMRMSIFLALLVALPGVAVFALFGRELVTIVFGASFADAAVPLVILSAANAIALLNGAVIPLLNMTGRERDTLAVFGSAVVINVSLNVILVPLFSMIGAATAAFISTCCWSFLLRRSARRRLSIDPLATLFSVYPPSRPPHGGA